MSATIAETIRTAADEENSAARRLRELNRALNEAENGGATVVRISEVRAIAAGRMRSSGGRRGE